MSEHSESYPWYLTNHYPDSSISKEKKENNDTDKKGK